MAQLGDQIDMQVFNDITSGDETFTPIAKQTFEKEITKCLGESERFMKRQGVSEEDEEGLDLKDALFTSCISNAVTLNPILNPVISLRSTNFI